MTITTYILILTVETLVFLIFHWTKTLRDQSYLSYKFEVTT